MESSLKESHHEVNIPHNTPSTTMATYVPYLTQESIQIPKYKLTTILYYYIMLPLSQQHPNNH